MLLMLFFFTLLLVLHVFLIAFFKLIYLLVLHAWYNLGLDSNSIYSKMTILYMDVRMQHQLSNDILKIRFSYTFTKCLQCVRHILEIIHGPPRDSVDI